MKNHFIICVFVKRNERNFTFTGLENFFNNDVNLSIVNVFFLYKYI